MVAERLKIVIIGAGMAGLTAARKLYSTPGAKEMFDVFVVEGGDRIGGRICTTEFGGDRVEMGATWIHGIDGSPVYEIARKVGSLASVKPWECMDGLAQEKTCIAEGGVVLKPVTVDPISTFFDKLMDFAQGKCEEGTLIGDLCCTKMSSIGSFLRLGLEQYRASKEVTVKGKEVKVCENWTREMLEEAVFSVYENIQRTYTGSGDLFNLDYASESEYEMFPGEEITIPKGYVTIVEALASVLPPGSIQLGKKVIKIEWQSKMDHGNAKPVKLHFSDGSVMNCDHVIVTVSLGVLKAGIREGSSLFSPSLPPNKQAAISRLGYGVVNKLFLQLGTLMNQEEASMVKFPFLNMVFHRRDSEFTNSKIPWWMRKTAALYPIYENANVLLSWFAGKEALELETLDDDSIIDGVSTTVSSFIPTSFDPYELSNGNGVYKDMFKKSDFVFNKVLRSRWGSDPLFLGSYSYVAVGSSVDDFDSLASPLPGDNHDNDDGDGYDGESTICNPLQIMFAGEATHRTHYSTTHGAYFSGLREANRLLQHYKLCVEDEKDTAYML